MDMLLLSAKNVKCEDLVPLIDKVQCMGPGIYKRADCMTLSFDRTHDLDPGVEVWRLKSEIALSQEWDDRLTWNEKDVSHPFMTMILTSVTMLGWADVPDSDWGDFRRRRAVDISNLCYVVMPDTTKVLHKPVLKMIISWLLVALPVSWVAAMLTWHSCHRLQSFLWAVCTVTCALTSITSFSLWLLLNTVHPLFVYYWIIRSSVSLPYRKSIPNLWSSRFASLTIKCVYVGAPNLSLFISCQNLKKTASLL